jgi:DNA-binding Xre family transcriptional regulator
MVYILPKLIILEIPNILPFNNIGFQMVKKEKIDLNRLRIVLAERNKTNRWLADQLGVTEGTVSKWATNNHQPPLERLYEISLIFKIDIHDLIESTLSKKVN